MTSPGYRQTGLSLLAIAAVWFAFSAPWFFTSNVIGWDAKNHFYAMVRFAARAWHEGESLMWSPFHYSGFPMISDPQSIIFTPTFWPVVLVSPTPSLAFVDVIHLCHLLVVGFAAYAFARTRNWLHGVAVLTAMTAMLGGALTLRLEHLLMTVSMMWFWVALWRLEATIVTGGLWRGVTFGLALGLMLLDRDHVAFLGATFLFLYWLCSVGSKLTSQSIGVLFKANVPIAVGGVLALLIVAVPLMLLLQLASTSNRPSFGLLDASWQSLHPAALLTFFMPEYFGPLKKAGLYWGPASATWGGEPLKMHRAMLHIYMGTLPLIILWWSGLLKGYLLKREMRFFFFASVLSLLYALGRYTPFFTILYEIAPGVDLFRRPADAVFIFGASIALLTGALLNHALTDQKSHNRFSKTGGAVAILSAGIIIGYGLYLAGERQGFHTVGPVLITLIVLCTLIGGLLTALFKFPQSRPVLLTVLIAFVAADLINHTARLQANYRPEQAYLPQQNPENDPVFQRLKTLLETRDPSGAPWRVETVGLGPTVQNIGQAAGFHHTLGYNPIRLGLFEKHIAPDMQNNAANRRLFGDKMTGYDSAMTNQLGLRYIATGAPIEEIDLSYPEGRFNLLDVIDRNGQQVYLYENPAALPRAVLRNDGKVQIQRYQNAMIEVNVVTDTPNRLVLHEFIYPGWSATVNGKNTPIDVENDLFRAIDLPAGDHEILFLFNPFSLSLNGN